MTKRGRKRKRNFVTPDGKELVGLVQDNDGRFRPAGRSSPKWSGSWQVAYHKFQVWQGQQQANNALEPLEHWEAGGRPSLPSGPQDPDHPMWAEYFRNLIATDPARAAIEMDYEPLALLAVTCPHPWYHSQC